MNRNRIKERQPKIDKKKDKRQKEAHCERRISKKTENKRNEEQ